MSSDPRGQDEGPEEKERGGSRGASRGTSCPHGSRCRLLGGPPCDAARDGSRCESSSALKSCPILNGLLRAASLGGDTRLAEDEISHRAHEAGEPQIRSRQDRQGLRRSPLRAAGGVPPTETGEIGKIMAIL